MSDINYWYEEYTKEVDAFKQLVDKLQSLLSSSNSKVIEQCIKDCEIKYNRVGQIKKSFQMELRIISDKNVKSQFEKDGRSLEENFNTINKNYTQAKTQYARKDLLKESKSGATGTYTGNYSLEGRTNDDLLTDANRIQDLTFESLSRTRNMIEASKEVGQATLEQLSTQREQIKDIEADVDTLASSLDRASKLVTNFTRRMATDRIIQCFAALNIVIMLGLILYVAISGKSLSASSNSGKNSAGPSLPQNPTTHPTFAPSI
eukprot:gene16837-23060_t